MFICGIVKTYSAGLYGLSGRSCDVPLVLVALTGVTVSKGGNPLALGEVE